LLFHTFATQEQRRKAGGGDFIEFQYCRCDDRTPLQKIISADFVNHWQADSLYVHGDDWERFISDYGAFFTDGFYNNALQGPVDLCGINYYPPQQVRQIVQRIKVQLPCDAAALLEWLEQAADCNGIYILGL